MTDALGGGELRKRRFLQTGDAQLAGFMGFDARGTKHHDGVADAFVFELDQRMQILRENAQRARRGAFQELGILVRNLGSVLWLELEVP